MACRLTGAKSLSEPMLEYCIVNWTLGNKLQWNLNQNSCVFIHENAFENVVWKMAAILSRPHDSIWESICYDLVACQVVQHKQNIKFQATQNLFWDHICKISIWESSKRAHLYAKLTCVHIQRQKVTNFNPSDAATGNRSRSRLLMPRILASPGHQQPW